MVRKKSPQLTQSSLYVLQQRVGHGGSAVVWRARAPDGCLVALKLARDRATSSTALVREALHAALALSPRLPDLRELGLGHLRGSELEPLRAEDCDEEALCFVALGWHPGRELGAVVAAAADPRALALRVAIDVGEALADLHAAGLAHGDVKLANIVYDEQQQRAALLDLGLAGPAHRRQPEGGTPRYLPRGDHDFGDARARDLLALGVVLAEIVDAATAAAAEAVDAARGACLPSPLDAICAALLAPEPGARPAADWVHDAAAASAIAPADQRAVRDRRRVRARYLSLRRTELARSSELAPSVAPWASEAVALFQRARQVCAALGTEPPAPLELRPERRLAPLDAEQRSRWLSSLVGRAAAAWPLGPLASASEADLAAALTRLATRKQPAVWSLHEIESELAGREPPPSPPRSADATEERLSAARAADLALSVARVPPDPEALATVERLGDEAPIELRLAAADALRLAGELGRARALVLHLPEAGAVVADVLRRAGDLTRAAEVALETIESGRDRGGRARACLARLHLDAGDDETAANLLRDATHDAATAEVAARLAAGRGEHEEAGRHARRGAALASGAEERARLAATVAYVTRWRGDLQAYRDGYRQAVEHAERAGAVLEEASYRTGEAAACVDLGEIDAAVDAARRAALLWEDVLGRPAMAARAWLARAAAYAAIDAPHEARRAAERAIERAVESGDRHAEAYAYWCIADACPAGSRDGVEAAERAAVLLADSGGDDELQAAARCLRHGACGLSDERIAAFDGRCRSASAAASAFARLAWWGARGEALVASSPADAELGTARTVLSELTVLAEVEAPVPTRGKAMFAACRLAALLGDSEALARLDAVRSEAARRVTRSVTSPLADAAQGCAWLQRRGLPRLEQVEPEQAIDLQALVRALSERTSLRALLDRVLDVLLLWTGAERGLLLLEDEGELRPHAARNLTQEDLSGEQLSVSTSLAQRARDSGEPVVAIDAMNELSQSYDSVHALKLRSVLALPLAARGQSLGVVYLDDRLRRGAFGDKELRLAQALAPVAALAIADARTQEALEQALDRAEQAGRELEQALAKKEVALDVAERELAITVAGRDTRHRFEDIVGRSEPMRRLLGLVDRVAQADVPILLRGESGSGKELVARAIHRASGRADQSFVSENCGALPETLLESALFGHVRGAFTGAHRSRVGLFEAADGGTLFLDEIGEMSLGMQTKLLRVLEDNTVRPVGSTHPLTVDVRIIAATHRDVEAMVAAGRFREDLYYRLDVVALQIPSLRERPDDIPLLVEHLLHKHAPGRRVRVTRAASARLQQHPWPGNVRQLENEVRRALLLADDVIDVDQLTIPADPSAGDQLAGLDLRAHIDRLEIDLVGQALERTSGNQTRAAKLLGISRFGLHKMLKRLGIDKDAH